MMRALIIMLVLAVLIAKIATGLSIRSDAGAIFGGGKASFATNPSLDVIVGIDADGPERRVAVAKLMATQLRADPLVQDVSIGPTPPSEEFTDWVWDKRFQLAPPGAGDFTPAAMAERLTHARAMFSSAQGLAMADQLLLDPSGSYLRAISQLQNASSPLGQVEGVWHSTDEGTALLFIKFADREFAAHEVHALIQSLRTVAAGQNAAVSFLGARTIAADTTMHTSRASARASLIAGGLLIAWLIFSLRSLIAAFFVLLPLALGVAGAVVITQLLFGYVHVISLGFGGALVGLALDYPIHLIGHSNPRRRQAFKLVLLGAMTTGLAFLAMLGSEIPALMQTGVFVASGLMISALASGFMPSPKAVIMTGIPLKKFIWTLPYKSWVQSGLAIGGLGFAVMFQADTALTLFGPPPNVAADIERMGTKLKLPSAQYMISVSGKDLDELIENQEKLSITLDAAIVAGTLVDYAMLSKRLPRVATSLPTPAQYRALAGQALELAGMSAAFADAQAEAYSHARSAVKITVKELQSFAETRAAVARLEMTATGYRETVQLFLPKNQPQLSLKITSPGAEFIDTLKPIQSALNDIQTQVILWLSLGIPGAVLLLAMGLKSWQRAWQIFLTSSAAIGVTAGIVTLVFGALGIFHILALALVVGIGVDYSLFLRELKDDNAAYSSVSLCASSTLIAFCILAFSGVQILHQIGLTVVVGLLVMLGLTLTEPQKNG